MPHPPEHHHPLRRIARTLLAALVLTIGMAPLVASAADRNGVLRIEKDIDDLKRDLAEIKQELQDIKQLLRSKEHTAPPQPGPEDAQATAEESQSLGEADTPLTLVEFVDYQCRLCATFHLDILPRLTQEFIDPGQLRYVARDLPMASLHPLAEKAAEAAHCADAQGYFWPMHNLLLEHQEGLVVEGLVEMARGLELNVDAFSECLTDGRYLPSIRRSAEQAERAGILGSPSYILGQTGADGVIRGRLLRGAQSYDALKREIEQLLHTP